MSATQDLIAAALRLTALAERNTDDRDEWQHSISEVREMCARAMVAQQRASDADMQVYQAIADGYTRDTQPVSAAEVPMPEPDRMRTGTDGELYGDWTEYQMIHYGDAREAAGYAAGLAAGGKDAEPAAYLYTLEYGKTVANTKVSVQQLNYPFGVCGADYLARNDDGVSYVRQTKLYTDAAMRGEVK